MPRPPRPIDLSAHTAYHIITHCNRQLRLLGDCAESRSKRKGVLLSQLERLARFTAVGVAGFSVMDNHLHLLLKVDADRAHRWTDREVVERCLALHPPRNGYYEPVDVEEEHIAVLCADRAKLESYREKLTSISQFMKELKQETSQRLNKLDDTVGSIWAGRFKCKAVKDEAQLLATMAYIDLNPFAANACRNPKSANHTSLTARIHGDPDLLRANKAGPSANSSKSISTRCREHSGWWLAIGTPSSKTKEADRILPGSSLTLGRYLKLIDHTARLLRNGKPRLGQDESPKLQTNDLMLTEAASLAHQWLTQGIRELRLPPLDGRDKA